MTGNIMLHPTSTTIQQSAENPIGTHTHILDFLEKNDLYLIPLQSIKDGICTCKNAECGSPGKHPLLKWNWKHVATNNRSKIEKWFNKSDVNYGIATGRKSNLLGNSKYLVVVDVDCEEHEILEKLPKTFSYRTGSGGWHFWFWSKYRFANSASKLAPKVDIRGNNGYVVIPPSKHISGSSYRWEPNFSFETPILDLPNFVVQKLSSVPCKVPGMSKVQISGADTTDKGGRSFNETNPWTNANISEIRSWISPQSEGGLGKQIPAGVRNTTIHRLLSSDRARGATFPELEKNIQAYISCCEQKPGSVPSIGQSEVSSILSQVIKYRAYNTSYEKVHTAFYDMIKRSKKEPVMTKAEFARMVEEDNKFFALLQQPAERSDVSTKINSTKINRNRWMTLDALFVAREEYMKEAGFSKWSKYPLPLLASKLRSLGFIRHRTAKQNVWNVEIVRDLNRFIKPENYDMIGIDNSSFLNNGEPLEMTMKIQDHTVKIKLKKHPSEPRYCGRENQELGSALLKLMTMLNPQEKQDFYEGKLVVDEDGTAEDFDAVAVGDRVGIALNFDDGWISTQVDITEIGNDTMKGKDFYTDQDIEFVFEDASAARAMGYFEILYRPADGWDGTEENKKLEPFGVDKEQEVKVRIMTDDGEPDAPAYPATIPNTGNGAWQQANPTATPPSFQEIEETVKKMTGGTVDPATVEALARHYGYPDPVAPATSASEATPTSGTPAAATATEANTPSSVSAASPPATIKSEVKSEVKSEKEALKEKIDSLIVSGLGPADPALLKQIAEVHGINTQATGPAVPARAPVETDTFSIDEMLTQIDKSNNDDIIAAAEIDTSDNSEG